MTGGVAAGQIRAAVRIVGYLRLLHAIGTGKDMWPAGAICPSTLCGSGRAFWRFLAEIAGWPGVPEMAFGHT